MHIDDLDEKALKYHEEKPAGKLSIALTKPTESQTDLALAYTPGVAVPVRHIAKNPDDAYRYTAKGNLVGVISNGSAILGLGNLGPLASKPVMEGKAVLFKRFADVDVFDIEIEAHTPDEIVETIARIAPTFGGINLEDIKAPECFEVERRLQSMLSIPVFHDDQHGTAIVIASALLNALEINGKDLKNCKIVCIGAGAAGHASCKLLTDLGARKPNIFMIDRAGVIATSREDLPDYKAAFANNTTKKTVADAMEGADILIGVSGPNTVTADDVRSMADNPVIFALSNPDPEIHPSIVKETRPDAIMATGRSDFPNQVNNVICFPYMFRGALDARATAITPKMCIAAVEAIRSVAKEPVPQSIVDLYPDIDTLSFGRSYLLPKPMDERLKDVVPKAVMKAWEEH